MRSALRIGGTVLVVAGLLGLAWAVTVWRWQDPFTALYTAQQQHTLARQYDDELDRYRPPPAAPKQFSEARVISRAARRYRMQLRTGKAVGRLKVPRLDLDAIVVNGTDKTSLTKGPGRYSGSGSYVPGEGELVYIAGHRTTYGAPFARIEQLRRGDRITLELPYATFVYRVRGSVIVPANDVGRLRSRGNEVVVLQACHPRFFATERYLVYAVPVWVKPARGPAYMPEI